jgi:hypothetical protein
LMGGPLCRGCGRPITGQYVTALGADWHAEHFRCAGCGRPIGETAFYEGDGHPYHKKCHTERFALRCAGCGRPIETTYYTHGGQPFHEKCHTERFAPRCAIGGEPIPGTWLENAWGERYCEAHGGECPRCRFCGRLAPGRAKPDARCSACRTAAVRDEGDARSRCAELIRWAIRHGMTVPDGVHFRVDLVDAAELCEEGGPAALGRAFKTTMSLNGRVTEIRADRVVVERGLPSPLFEGVALHELGHAWLATQQVGGLPEWAEEGFCELLAHRWLGEQGTPEARYYATQLAENPDAVYGGGFRRLDALSQRLGLHGVVATLRTTKRLPTVGEFR